MNALLVLLLAIPLVGAVVVALSPDRQAGRLALLWTMLALGATVFGLFVFDWSKSGDYQFATSVTLSQAFGVRFALGADSVSMWLIALTALLGPICVAASFTSITERPRLFYGSLLVLQTAMTGVFASRDLILFYVCFEFTLAPMFILIRQYGSTNRRRASIKFFLYTFTGSMIALAGLVYVAWRVSLSAGGRWTFDIETLSAFARQMPDEAQAWVLLAMLAGFAVKVPLFPVHTWLPLAHTEAPTAGSVILAGVLLKLGTYGIYRFVIPFVPVALIEYAPAIAVVCIIGIIYAGLICWVQRDVKKLVAYSSVSHLGFCVLGLVALNTVGLGGSVMYMINHGLSTGALFLCIGMMYERYHTRSLDEVGGLINKMPAWAFFMVFFTMASVGLPGLNGFVGEFMCMMGAFQSGAGFGPGATQGPLGPAFAIVAASGVIVAAIYLLYMVGRIVFGPLREPDGHHHHGPLPVDLNAREIAVLTPLAVGCLVLGVLPSPMLRTLEAPIQKTLVAAGVVMPPEAPAPAPLPGHEGHDHAARPVDAAPFEVVAADAEGATP